MLSVLVDSTFQSKYYSITSICTQSRFCIPRTPESSRRIAGASLCTTAWTDPNGKPDHWRAHQAYTCKEYVGPARTYRTDNQVYD